MKVKVIYPRNLKMSEQKVASQVAHAVRRVSLENLSDSDVYNDTIIVLKVSQTKFQELITEQLNLNNNVYIQTDAGHTEVPPGTRTAAAWIIRE